MKIRSMRVSGAATATSRRMSLVRAFSVLRRSPDATEQSSAGRRECN